VSDFSYKVELIFISLHLFILAAKSCSQTLPIRCIHEGYKCFVTANVLKSSTDDSKVVVSTKIKVIFIETVCAL
jgi:hypothetical protein